MIALRLSPFSSSGFANPKESQVSACRASVDAGSRSSKPVTATATANTHAMLNKYIGTRRHNRDHSMGWTRSDVRSRSPLVQNRKAVIMKKHATPTCPSSV